MHMCNDKHVMFHCFFVSLRSDKRQSDLFVIFTVLDSLQQRVSGRGVHQAKSRYCDGLGRSGLQ